MLLSGGRRVHAASGEVRREEAAPGGAGRVERWARAGEGPRDEGGNECADIGPDAVKFAKMMTHRAAHAVSPEQHSMSHAEAIATDPVSLGGCLFQLFMICCQHRDKLQSGTAAGVDIFAHNCSTWAYEQGCPLYPDRKELGKT